MFFSSLSHPLAYPRSVGWRDFDGLLLILRRRHQTEGPNRMQDRTNQYFSSFEVRQIYTTLAVVESGLVIGIAVLQTCAWADARG